MVSALHQPRSTELLLSNGLLWLYAQGHKNHLFSAGDWLGTYMVAPDYSLNHHSKLVDLGNKATILFSRNEDRIIKLDQNQLVEQNGNIQGMSFEPALSNSLAFRQWRNVIPSQDPLYKLAEGRVTRKHYPVIQVTLDQKSSSFCIQVEFADYRKKSPILEPYSIWRQKQVQVAVTGAGNQHQSDLFQKSLRSLYKLRVVSPWGMVKVAGFPNFPSIFGRDFGISALGEIYLDPLGIRDETRIHLQLAGTKNNPVSGEQIGRAAHEYLLDIESHQGRYPQFPNYFANDANALLIINAFRLARIQHDFTIVNNYQRLLAKLWNHMLQLRSEATGLVTYAVNPDFFIRHQTFRDSGDAIQHPDGSEVISPIAPLHDQLCFLGALTELEWYVSAGYISPLNLSPDTLHDLIMEMSTALEHHYWMPKLQGYALALDGQGSQVKVLNSDIGLGLYYQLFRASRVQQMYNVLTDSSRLLSPVGVRTVSKEHPIYNSSNYLQGAVWPWQLAMILVGIHRYGLDASPFYHRFDNLSLAGTLHEVYDADDPALLPLSIKKASKNEDDTRFICIEQRWSASVVWLVLIEGILGIDIPYQIASKEIMEKLEQIKHTQGYSISNIYLKGKRYSI